MKRVLTALVLVPTITYLVLWAPRIAFIAALVVIGGFAFREFSAIASGHGLGVNPWIGTALGLVMLVLPSEHGVLLVLLATAFGAMMASLRLDDLRQSLPSAAALLLGLCYIFGSWWCAAVSRPRCWAGWSAAS